MIIMSLHTRRWFARAGLYSGVVAVAGCNDTGEQRQLALESVRAWGELYNRRSWDVMHQQADERFRRNLSVEEWKRTCDDLFEALGRFQGFERRGGNSWPAGPVGIVWLDGHAQFAKKRVLLRVDWQMSGQTAKLWNLEFRFDGKVLSYPGFNR